MITTIITALLPIVVTLALGYFAGWHHDFTQDQASVLIKMVMNYALPMALFAGIITTPIRDITEHLSVLLWIAIAMVGGLLVVIALSRFVFRSDWGTAALRGLAIAAPSVPFVGIPVLGDLYPAEADVAVAIGSLLMNIILVPISLILLNYGASQVRAAAPSGASGSGATGSGTSGGGASGGDGAQSVGGELKSILLDTVKKPVVWLPLLGFVLILFGVDLPKKWEGSFTLLGGATGGVALFAVGAVLYVQKVGFSWAIAINVLSKNFILPAIVLLGMWASGMGSGHDIGLATVTVAIPSASVCVIFAVQYKLAEREMAATLFLSTVLSVGTMGLFIWAASAI